MKEVLFMSISTITNYMELMTQRPQLFTSHTLEIQKDPALLQEYVEKTGTLLGVVYRSKYHTMLVDLVRGEDGNYFPYERIVQTSIGKSVVLVPIFEEKFILLKQYRHALQETQLSFPRGFGEDHLSAEENAAQELKEELGAAWTSLHSLGEVVADSGLSSNKASVFYGTITPPKLEAEEGIQELLSVSLQEMETLIREGAINDGFTLSAFSLYSQRKIT